MSCSNNENKSSESKQTEQSGKKIRWKMASTFSVFSYSIRTMGIRFQDQISKVSGKNIRNKIFLSQEH